MNEPRDPEVERLLQGLQPQRLPSDLRSRVVPAARARMADEVVPDLWSRIWNHRGFRLAWGTALILLVAGHILVGSGNGVALRPVDPAVIAESGPDEQFISLMRPVRISENVQPIVGLFAAAGEPIDLEVEGSSS